MQPSSCRVANRKTAFTMVELLAAIAIIALLVAVIVPVIGNFLETARKTADKQTLAVLNDALTRYKTMGGDMTALTSGASIGNVLTKLQTAVTWCGMRHQFLRTGTTYTAASLSAINDGAQYKFTRFGEYADGTEYSNGILSTYAAEGYDVGDEEEFKSWLAEAMAETGSTNYLALTNPDTTDRFGIYARVASSDDKVQVWWGDGSTQDYNSITPDSSYGIGKTWATFENRTIVIVGNLSLILSNYTDGRTNFGGDISKMSTLENITIWGNNTISGDVGLLSGLETLSVHDGANTLSGNLTSLNNLRLVAVTGQNSISGDITGKSNLNFFRMWGHNTITGSLSCDSTEYLSLGGNSTIDVDSIINLTSSSLELSMLSLGNTFILSQSQVDALLINMDSNKEETKPRAERFIDIAQGNHATPSASGLAAKASLEAAGWTVNTN